MQVLGRKGSLYSGIILVATGALFKKWLIEIVFAADNRIDSALFVSTILLILVIAIVAGAFLMIKRPIVAIRRPSKVELIPREIRVTGTRI